MATITRPPVAGAPDAAPPPRPCAARAPLPKPGRILLLAMLPIGDTLFAAPTIAALRGRYPGAAIVALGYASNAPLLRCLPGVDEVLVLPVSRRPAGAAALASMLADLRARRFDAAVDFTSPAYKWVGLLAGIPRRTYMKFDPLWWLIPAPHARWRRTHATRIYYDCARELDLPAWEAVAHVPRFVRPAGARAAARAFLGEHDIAAGGPLVVVHPGGAGLNGQKRWPPDRFAAVADHLCARWRARVVLLGGAEEAGLTDAVAAAMRHPAVGGAGQLSLLASFALLGGADLFIGNDSSLLHAAAAQGTPYVGIYGPTSLANFQPLPARPRQGRLVAPWPPCDRASYFVGGRPIWQSARREDAAAGQAAIDAAVVTDYADELLAGAPRRAPRPDAPPSAVPRIAGG